MMGEGGGIADGEELDGWPCAEDGLSAEVGGPALVAEEMGEEEEEGGEAGESEARAATCGATCGVRCMWACTFWCEGGGNVCSGRGVRLASRGI